MVNSFYFCRGKNITTDALRSDKQPKSEETLTKP